MNGQLWKNLCIGASIFAIGLFKKVVIADTLGEFVDPVFSDASFGYTVTSLDAWLAMICFTLQIYFDFSGYSDMAIGLAKMVGINLPINFLSPFKSANIAEFWRRWHITLTKVVTDYFFTPMSMKLSRWAYGSRSLRKFCELLGDNVPILITFVILGIWHGAGRNFIVFGLLHGAFMITYQVWTTSRLSGLFKLNQHLSILLTFFCVNVAFVFFRADSVDTALTITKTIFLFDGIVLPQQIQNLLPSLIHSAIQDTVIFSETSNWQGSRTFVWISFAIALIWLAPNTTELFQSVNNFQKETATEKFSRIFCKTYGNFLLIFGSSIILVISAFQAIPEFSKLLPTYLTLVASLLIIIISFVRVQSEVSVSHLRPSFFWCIVLSILITFGILDLWIDDGVEFIYFEF